MSHPYTGLPDRQFWKRDPGIDRPDLLDPVVPPPFAIAPTDRIVTAGSCFAQHLARHLSQSGFTHHVTETAHPVVPDAIAQAHHYGLFSARYGNVYTARQLRQLIERALGRFEPLTSAWPAADGTGVVDPFRPQIQPGGYLSRAELEADRRWHLSCVRRALVEAQVFVFTLGLTEAWTDPRDGAVYPLAPGVAGGAFDPETCAFRNFDEGETAEDLLAALNLLREVNPEVRIILTVSPVPLNATYEDRHVLVSTTWSKAVLRIAAERAARSMPDCVYFPSFEIITSPHVRGRYFAADCREVTAEGVSHVMRLFLRHFASAEGVAHAPSPAPRARDHSDDMEERIEILCDEEAIDNR